MRRPIVSLAAAVLIAALQACATSRSGDVKVYGPAELRQGDYETVSRIWVGSWRTAAWVPSYSSREDGISALKDKAASLDANGLINVACYGDRGLFGGSDAYTCYAKAIKVGETAR
jgi:hypothetical protein